MLVILIVAVGSFYWGRHISSIEQRNELIETTHAEALKHIDDLESHLEEIKQEYEIMHQEMKDRGERIATPRAWNPADPLNSSPRQ